GSGGLSIGLIKPVYISAEIPGNESSDFRIVRYNPSDNYVAINGEANFFYGIKNLSIKPGLYIKSGFLFDYNLLDKKVTAIEVGLIYDYFLFPRIGFEGGKDFFSEVPV